MFLLTLYLTKLISFFIKTFKLGSGYTWPGHIALKINPNFLSSKQIKFNRGIVFISGTNGKTTTSKLITHFLEASKLKATHNKTGANLLNGIAASILLDMDLLGRLKSDVGVFEIDEFTLPLALKHFTPNVLVLLNLSRDQLDRYGEVDIIFDKWKESIAQLPSTTVLVVDETQPIFKPLSSVYSGEIKFFGFDPEVSKHAKIPGKFNIKNVNAAYEVAKALGLDLLAVKESLNTFEVAYGRGEILKYKDKHFQLFLAKNPASFNHNLETINGGHVLAETLLFVLNDNIPDGRDVSWIYDVIPEDLKQACQEKTIYIAGTRALDMAIRLNYAGVEIDSDNIGNLSGIIEKITNSNGANTILALPNYSAMLELRKILTGRSIL